MLNCSLSSLLFWPGMFVNITSNLFGDARPLAAILLDRVTAKIGGGLPKWNKLRQIRQIAPTIKRYRYDHIMRKVIPIEDDEQEIAIFLPTERFKKAGKTKVWSESERKFG